MACQCAVLRGCLGDEEAVLPDTPATRHADKKVGVELDADGNQLSFGSLAKQCDEEFTVLVF